MHLLFLCLPLLKEFSALQNENGILSNVSPDTYPNLNASMEEGSELTSNRIKACLDFKKCPWDNFETLPSQAFLEPDASQSEIARAKETYLAKYGSGSQNIDDCFKPLVLTMRKEDKDCSSMFSNHKKEYLNKFGVRLDVPQTEMMQFLIHFTEKEGVTIDFYLKCRHYLLNTNKETYESMMPLDVTSKLPFKIVNCIISIFGLVGNLALFVIYVRKDQKVRFNSLMLLITSFDFIFLVFQNVRTVIELTEDVKWIYMNKPIYLRIILFLYGFTFTGSVYTTILVNIERYLILCREK